jgi:general secretion pathway protein C
MAASARFVPHIADGRPIGFKLYAIRPGSIFDRLGIRNGDTVVAINGLSMDTPDHALEVYASLRNATQFTVDLKRNGKPVTLKWKIVGKLP